MHHEEHTSKEVSEALDASLLGPTGRFPGGKLTSNDKGEIAFAVGTLKGKVIVNFGTPIASLGMSVKEARKFAASLIREANAISRPGNKRERKKGRRRKV